MFRFGNNIGSKRGSLVLSLVASGTVAATIVATHQVTQRFASGAVGAYNQQAAYILAQRSLAVAGLMVHRNVVHCSSVIESGKAIGCKWVDPARASNNDEKSKAFYANLRISSSWFTAPESSTDAYAAKHLVFKDTSSACESRRSACKSVFKNAEVTWALRTLTDTNLRSISTALNAGYTCRNVKTWNVIEKGICPSFDSLDNEEKLLGNRDSRLLSDEDQVCKNKVGADIADSVCDYYADSDGDAAIVFISVKVPYAVTNSEEESVKHLVVNAAIRRPMPIVKTFVKEDSSMCPVSCGIASRPHMAGDDIEHPDCVGFVAGSESGGNYFQNEIHAVESAIKVKNYGPGALYGLELFKEDIDPRTGRLLGRSISSLSNNEPLEPFDSGAAQDGERDITDITPCYSSSFYRPNLMRVSCDCDASEYKNTASGVVCLKGKSVCGDENNGSNDKSIFADNTPATLEGSEARESLSGCLHFPGDQPALPAVSSSILTVFEKPCKDTGACEFTRINADQTLTQKESWCGNKYVDNSPSTHPTGRGHYATAPLTNNEETVFSAANQDNIPLNDGVLP